MAGTDPRRPATGENGSAGALADLRRGNQARLLQLLRDYGPLHRAELARRTGLSRSAVSALLNPLIKSNELHVVNPKPGGSVGRGGELIAINVQAGALVGVDFSLMTVRAVLTDLAHRNMGDRTATLSDDAEWPQRLQVGLALINELSEAAADLPLAGVGMGIPDPIDLRTGTIGHSRSGPAWTNARVRELVVDHLHVPVVLDNTSHLAALAELLWGAVRGARNALYVKMSYGVGAGLVFDGRIYRGGVGAAGELGHVSIDDGGPACPCGNRGCLELYVGGTALLGLFRPIQAGATLDELIASALDGDRVATRLIEDAGATTGRVLASVCNLLNPELVIVGGELVDAGDLLLEPMRGSLHRRALSVASSHVRIVPAQLGHLAGAMGGVALIDQHLYNPANRPDRTSATTDHTRPTE